MMGWIQKKVTRVNMNIDNTVTSCCTFYEP